MKRREFPEKLEDDETPEQYVANRLADINRKEGFIFTESNPDYPKYLMGLKMREINKLCDEIEDVLPSVEKLVKRISTHIKIITERTKIAAIYLLIGRAYSNLETTLIVCRCGKNIEAMELSRSGKEALDLAMFFWEDENKASLEKWFNGKIIGNAEAREFQHKYLNKELADTFGNKEQPIQKMLGKGYKIMSSYTHSGYAGILDSVDVLKLDFDFENQSGYYYSVDNFHIVQDLLIKILLNLKNSFLHLDDKEGFAEADKILKPFFNEISQEEMKTIFSKHKKETK